MDLAAAGLVEQPFPTYGKPVAIVTYRAERDALRALSDTRESKTGVTLIQGPTLSGKSTIIQTYLEQLPADYPVAVIDGKGLDTTNLLLTVLEQYGYELERSSENELLGLVRVFVMQQATSVEAPMLIVENVHELHPSSMRALCELAELRVRNGCAIKLVLVGERPLKPLVLAPAMKTIAARVIHDFHLRPMSREETRDFLHAKLRTAGCEKPESIFTDELCSELWEASGGWPGILDRVALLSLASATTLPVPLSSVERPSLPNPTWDQSAALRIRRPDGEMIKPPHVVVTNNASVLREVAMSRPRMLIGRSEHNDIAINSRFISRHHALLVRHGSATFLMDLNSTNGTFVNAERVSNHVLRHEDVITVGHHRVKFYDPYATGQEPPDSPDFTDTAVMKTLQDMRKMLAKENTKIVEPDADEDLPTIQT